MADTNLKQRVDTSDFDESDPFAELTRIMGHDPRIQTSPAAAPSDEDFGIDLEQELLKDLGFEEFDAPANEAEAAAEPAVESGYAEEQPAEASYAVAEEQGWEIPAEPGEPIVDDQAAEPVDSYVSPDADDVFGGDFDDAFTAQAEEQPAAWHQEPVLAEALDAGTDDISPSGQWDDEPAAEAQPVAAASAELIPSGESFEDEDFLADVDMDFGDVLAEHQPEPAGLSSDDPIAYEPAAEEPLEASVEAVTVAIVPEPVEEQAPLSLEDELSAMLAGEEGQQPAADAGTSNEPVEDDWQPAVSTFGAGGSFDDPDEPEPATEPYWEPQDGARTDESRFDEGHWQAAEAPAPETGDAWAEEADQPAEAALPACDDEAEPAYEPDAVYESEPAYEPEPEDNQPQAQAHDPFAVFSNLAPAAAVAQPFARQPAQSWLRPAPDEQPADHEVAAEPESGHGFAEPFDVETVSVNEDRVPVADELDLPELPAQDEPPSSSVFDEFEAEFADAFAAGRNDAAAQEPVEDYVEPGTDTGYHSEAYAAADAGSHYGDYGHEAAHDPAMAAGHAHSLPPEEYPLDEYAYQRDLEQAMATSFDEAENDGTDGQRSRRRGLFIAGALAGVALIGGIGVFGMSFFGDGGSTGPVTIRADADPIRIKPENPGGAVVPNQDNEVYQRVAGTDNGRTVEQESLITTAEEPIDMAAARESEALAPGISTDDDDMPAVEALPGVKSQDRIEQAEQQEAPPREEFAALEPRRVRTMIVQPDGTLVPREEPEAAVPEVNGAGDATSLAAASEATDTTPMPSSPGNDEAASGETGTAPAASVEQAQLIPARTEPAQPAAAPTPAATTPAATAPAATNAPASEWSMQIASQPSAESAQETYQVLARRYGNVLEGRGVNIVRANIEGKGVYYRVRIPTSSRDEAINLCTDYKSAGGSCFVSR